MLLYIKLIWKGQVSYVKILLIFALNGLKCCLNRYLSIILSFLLFTYLEKERLLIFNLNKD